jgi:hypothetical protein
LFKNKFKNFFYFLDQGFRREHEGGCGSDFGGRDDDFGGGRGGGFEGGQRGPVRGDHSLARIVGQFKRDGNEALRVTDGVIRQNSNNIALVTQLQTIRSTFATCEQTALQNLATAINVTVPQLLQHQQQQHLQDREDSETSEICFRIQNILLFL